MERPAKRTRRRVSTPFPWRVVTTRRGTVICRRENQPENFAKIHGNHWGREALVTLHAKFRTIATLARVRLCPKGPIDDRALRREVRRSRRFHGILDTPDSISVIIPCYGHASFLRSCLDSVLRQSLLPDEVVAVVDASPDDSEEILLEYQEAFVRKGVAFSVLKNRRNVGQAATINRGVRHASSELMMVLNDDDVLFDDSVFLSLKYFKSQESFALLGGSCVPFSAEEELALHRSASLPRKISPSITVHPRYAVEGYSDVADFNITHSGMTFLKTAWKIAGGYRPQKSKRVVKFSDRDFQFRMNCYFPIAALDDSVPLAFWRKGFSVDKGLNS